MSRTLTKCLLLGVLFSVACGLPKPVTYRLPQIAALPIGALTVRDARPPFADLFCGVLSPASGPWAACETYLHLESPAHASVVLSDDDFLRGYRVLLIGGIFARCLDVTVFQDAAQHLRDAHQAKIDHLNVFGNGSSEQNAVLIRDYILAAASSEPFIVVGHSKGGVDLLEALVHHPELQAKVKALLTVASPVAGSRLVDAVPRLLKALSDKFPQIGTCELGDGRGYVSLERSTRQQFFSHHLSEVNAIRGYGIAVGVSQRVQPVQKVRRHASRRSPARPSKQLARKAHSSHSDQRTDERPEAGTGAV